MWAALITGGAALAGGLLQEEGNKDDRKFLQEKLDRELADNQLSRDAQMERLMEEIGMQMQLTAMKTDADKEIAKKNLVGQGMLEQGKSGNRMFEISLNAAENRPERYNDAASVLAQVLRGRVR